MLAEAGDPGAAMVALDALPRDRMDGHQPWWVARARVARLEGNVGLEQECLQRAVALTDDDAVRAFLMDQQVR